MTKLNIQEVEIKNLRLFKQAKFNPSSNFNLLTGPNGSGKTSILESIYLLSRCKSFRTNLSERLIHNNEQELLIASTINYETNIISHIGIKITKTKTLVHLNANKQKKLSDHVKQVPLGIVTPDTQRLLTDGPKYRRKFLNWGVFHVEHEYASLVNTYSKILTQRNSILKQGRGYHSAWDNQFVQYGNEIDELRKKYMNLFMNIFTEIKYDYPELRNVNIDYKRGWKNNVHLLEAINSSNSTNQGVTYFGPHRADLYIYLKNHLAIEVLSKGQQKILSILLILTQLLIVKRKYSETPLLLIDDLQSELDDKNIKKIIKSIHQQNIQTFITSIDPQIYDLFQYETRLFHVEHGEIS